MRFNQFMVVLCCTNSTANTAGKANSVIDKKCEWQVCFICDQWRYMYFWNV